MLEMFNNTCFESYRIETFKETSFYTSKSKCNAKKLAESGLYATPCETEPDRVTCYVCNINLYGWKKTDDPWAEHLKQNPNCFYLKTRGSPKNELNIYDFLTIEKHRFHRINKDEYEISKKQITAKVEQLTQSKITENE